MLLKKSGVIHEQKFATESIGTHLRQIAPSLFGATVHSFAKTVPLTVNVNVRSTGHGRSGDSGKLIVTGLIILSISVGINGVNLSEEPIGVISELIRIGQDVLHGQATSGNIFKNAVLLDQSILKHRGILIQNAGGFNTEVINDGGGFLA